MISPPITKQTRFRVKDERMGFKLNCVQGAFLLETSGAVISLCKVDAGCRILIPGVAQYANKMPCCSLVCDQASNARASKKTPGSPGVWDVTDIKMREEVLARTPVDEIWGIGKQNGAKLNARGINTALQLSRASPKQMRQLLTVVGERIVQELNGVSCIPLELIAPPKKGITVSCSFGRYLTDQREVKEALSTFVMRLGEKLRRENLMTQDMHFFIKTSPHSKTQRYYCSHQRTTLPYPTDFTPDLMRAADKLLQRAWKPKLAYVKCGVMAMDLWEADRHKADLFDARNPEKQAALMAAMDSVNGKCGARTLRFASMGSPKAAWSMRAELKSKNYTTRWKDVLCIP